MYGNNIGGFGSYKLVGNVGNLEDSTNPKPKESLKTPDNLLDIIRENLNDPEFIQQVKALIKQKETKSKRKPKIDRSIEVQIMSPEQWSKCMQGMYTSFDHDGFSMKVLVYPKNPQAIQRRIGCIIVSEKENNDKEIELAHYYANKVPLKG